LSSRWQTTPMIEALRKWLKDSRLKVNESKTELCLFYKRDIAPVPVVLKQPNSFQQILIIVLGYLTQKCIGTIMSQNK
jgi:hypothetical protein